MKLITFSILLAMLVVGCGRSLKETAPSLKAGMNKDDVKQLFKDFSVSETNEVGKIDIASEKHGLVSASSDIDMEIKLYSTNNAYASCVTFSKRGFFTPWDSCYVYFDTNNIIVAHRYLLIH